MHDVARKHQLRIARRTLELSDIGAEILGGMTKEEAREILERNNITGAHGRCLDAIKLKRRTT